MNDEPVMTVDWIRSAVLATASVTISVLSALDVWHPTDAQVTAITGALAVVIAVVFPLVSFFAVRARVTPVATQPRITVTRTTRGR